VDSTIGEPSRTLLRSVREHDDDGCGASRAGPDHDGSADESSNATCALSALRAAAGDTIDGSVVVTMTTLTDTPLTIRNRPRR
jgi:hypothetical protein